MNNRFWAATFVLLAASLASVPASAGLISVDITYTSGPGTFPGGTGLFVYDDVTDESIEWSWSFTGLGDGFANVLPCCSGTGSVIADILLGNSATSFILSSSQITGFPGDGGRDFHHNGDGTFFMGSGDRGASGTYTAALRQVPEPGTLGLLGVGLLGLGFMRRKQAA